MHVIAPDDFEVAEVILAVFEALVGGDVGDSLAVGRPLEAVNAGFGLGELNGFAAIGADGEELLLAAFAVAGKGEPLAVGRPPGAAGALLAARQLAGVGRC